MRHSIDGIDPNIETTLEVLELNDICIIQVYNGQNMASSQLDLERLHSFIGTLLHVQQKIKNR